MEAGIEIQMHLVETNLEYRLSSVTERLECCCQCVEQRYVHLAHLYSLSTSCSSVYHLQSVNICIVISLVTISLHHVNL